MTLARTLETVALLLWAWVAAVPLTRMYAAARWPVRIPGVALLGWQAVGLTGGLAVLTAALSVTAFGRVGPWRDAVRSAVSHPRAYGPAQVVGLVLLVAAAGWLLVVLGWSFRRAATTRARHRTILSALARRAPVPGDHVELLEAEPPLSYAVPRATLRGDGQVVVTRGAWERLGADEVAAVIAHERTHLRRRHSLLVQPFVAWRASLPFLSAPALARAKVEVLVEYVCDDAAVARCGRDALSAALSALLPTGEGRDDRVDRLVPASWSNRRRTVLGACVVAVSLLLVFGPPAVLLALPV